MPESIMHWRTILSGLLCLTVSAEANQPSGRFVQFSRQAKGSAGAVQIKAATYFGGADNEAFSSAAFLPDGSILAAVQIRSSSRRDIVLGQDAETAATTDTGALVHYDSVLRNVLATVRLPWDAGSINQTISGDKSVYIAGRTGPRIRSLLDATKQVVSVGKEDAANAFVAALTPDLKTVSWVTLFEQRNLHIDRSNDDRLWVESGRSVWILDADGAVSPGPELDARVKWRARTPVATDPRDGSFYIGGEYHSSTGLEPWRCPLLHKFDRNGKIIWTAWNWTGPIVGAEPYRLVSDSAVRQVKVGAGGDILVGGWSDGGNSVFLHQPYDLTQRRPASKFGDSVWGAGVLSVAHIMRLDRETMELKGGTTWLTYHAYVNKPNSARLRDLEQLSDGRVVFTGGASYGLIETPDAWVPAWSKEYAENPETARVKGGPFFAMLSPDFSELLFSSVVPGLREQKLKAKGRSVLIYGAAESLEYAYEMYEPNRHVHPVQKTIGGGPTDAYIMLIDGG
ncbi:MAG: hypothetical protein AAF492_17100, partial [Verrucomicrobiota bacterium]